MGDVAKMASMAMMFMDRGGSVNPWDAAQGFDSGGDVEEVDPEMFNRIDAQASDYSRPIEGPAPNLGMWPFNRGQADYKGDVTMYPPPAYRPGSPLDSLLGDKKPMDPAEALRAEGLKREAMTRAAAAQGANGSPVPAMPGPGTVPASPYQLTPATPAAPPALTPPSRVASDDPARQPYARPGGLNSDMKISDFQMPKDQNPYPDALNRDWGQKAVRSPWMSLVEAGAKMAQHVGPPGSAIGAGLQAGIGALSKERTELRNEQQINQKADELYRHAKSELNKYTRKTPHELAIEAHQNAVLAQGKYQFVNYTDPATGELKVGRADTKHGSITDPATGQPVSAGRLMGRASATGVLSPGNITSIQNAVYNDVTIPQANKAAEIDKRIKAAAAASAQQHNAGIGAPAPQPPQGAIQALKLNPGLRADFEAKYPGWLAKNPVE